MKVGALRISVRVYLLSREKNPNAQFEKGRVRCGLHLHFVYRRTGPSLLVAEGRLNTKGRAVVLRSKTGRGKDTAPIFLLVPQAELPKRLDLAWNADRALDSVPGQVMANWVEGRN